VKYHTPEAKRIAMLLAFFAFAVSAFVIALSFGSLRLSFGELLVLLGGGGDPLHRAIVLNVRLPRNVCAALVGACLAVSGSLLQGIMRNPLAAPNLIGVSSGGGLAAMIVLIAFPSLSGLLVPAAFLGALGTTALIYALAWKRGVLPTRLVLAGVAVSSLLGSFINALMIFFPHRVSGVVDFMVGSLAGRTWDHVDILWPYAAVGLALAFASAPRLNVLALGDEAAIGLGLKVESTRLLAIAAASLLAAASVSVVGLLGFVGLIAPHIARLLTGSDFRVRLPASALFGAGLLLSCDAIARMLFDPVELPAGVVTAALGAPFFLYLLRGKSRHGTHD
jgi:iron complex transport system permease protein